jgi:hypothetical protein
MLLPLGEILNPDSARLTIFSDFCQTETLVVAWKMDARSIMLDRNRAQTRIVPMELRGS